MSGVRLRCSRNGCETRTRVWVALSHASWAGYCGAEFGISRAQAYRLLGIARAAGVIRAAITAADPAGPDGSRMRDSVPGNGDGTDVAVDFDFGLSQRALQAVAGRGLDVDAVRAIVHQAVHDVRPGPAPGPGEPTAALSPAPAVDPAVEGRRAYGDRAAHRWADARSRPRLPQ